MDTCQKRAFSETRFLIGLSDLRFSGVGCGASPRRRHSSPLTSFPCAKRDHAMRRDRQRALRLLNVVLIVCVQAYVVEASQQGSFAVPVRRMPAARRGRLLQEANAPATPNATVIRVRQRRSVVSDVFMTLTLAGGQQFELLVDTASVPTYLPCKGCTRERCGSHLHRYYDYDRSSDFERLNCSSRAEDAALCTAIHRADCQSDGTCKYDIRYLDSSSSVGRRICSATPAIMPTEIGLWNHLVSAATWVRSCCLSRVPMSFCSELACTIARLVWHSRMVLSRMLAHAFGSSWLAALWSSRGSSRCKSAEHFEESIAAAMNSK